MCACAHKQALTYWHIKLVLQNLSLNLVSDWAFCDFSSNVNAVLISLVISGVLSLKLNNVHFLPKNIYHISTVFSFNGCFLSYVKCFTPLKLNHSSWFRMSAVKCQCVFFSRQIPSWSGFGFVFLNITFLDTLIRERWELLRVWLLLLWMWY